MKKLFPGIVQTIEDAGCFGRPFRVELRAIGNMSAMFEGPPGPKKVYCFL